MHDPTRYSASALPGTISEVLLRSVTVALPLAVGTTLVFYPGFLSNDSLQQLGQARSGVYTDQHPPLMAFIWRYLDLVAPGPFGMLLLQNMLYWTGLALTALTVFGGNRRYIAMFLAVGGLFPPYFALQGVIWKDVLMNSSLLLAFGLLVRSWIRSEVPPSTGTTGGFLSGTRPLLLVTAACVPIIVAMSMRFNGLFAAIPLLWMACFIVVRGSRLSFSSLGRTLLLSVPLVGLSLGAQMGITRTLTDKPTYIAQLLAAYDLVGISVSADRSTFALERYPLLEKVLVPPGVGLETLKAKYDPCDAFPIFVTSTWGEQIYTRTYDPEVVAQIWKAWRHAVAEHPQAYLTHRFRVFSCSLGFGKMGPWYAPYFIYVQENARPYGISWEISSLQRWLAIEVLSPLSRTPVYYVYVYVLAALAVVVCCLTSRRREDVPALFLALSGISYQVGYAAIGITTEFRYYSWTIIATVISLLLFTMPRIPQLMRSRNTNFLGVHSGQPGTDLNGARQ